MEYNRDEAEKCVKLAEEAMAQCQFDKAKKFLEKAEKLYPTQESENLLKEVLAKNQEYHVKRILRKQNHYMVLQVPINATTAEIKSNYNRISLLVHEDKNHAPGAKEAMAKVNEAKATLTDPEARKKYNLLIAIEEANAGNAADTANQDSNTNNGDTSHQFKTDAPDDDVTWFENDGSFSYGEHTSETRNRRASRKKSETDSSQNPSHGQQRASGPKSMIRMLSLVMIIIKIFTVGLIVILCTSKPSHSSQTMYSFTEDGAHVIQRRTIELKKLQYFVTDKFAEQLRDYYGNSLGAFERIVKDDYKSKLKDSCDRQRKHNIYIACKELKELFGTAS